MASSLFRGMLSDGRRYAKDKAKQANSTCLKGFDQIGSGLIYGMSMLIIIGVGRHGQKKSNIARTHSLSDKDGGISKHTGGSIPFATHKGKLLLAPMFVCYNFFHQALFVIYIA